MTFKGHFSYFKLVNYQNLEIILRTNYFTTVTLPLQLARSHAHGALSTPADARSVSDSWLSCVLCT